jgi:PDZ domain-containing protein
MRKLAVLVPLAALGVVLSSVPLPAYSLGPGPARDVEPRIHVTGRTRYPSEGRFVLTSVSFERLTAFEAVAAWLDPGLEVVPEAEILGPGGSEEESDRQAVSQMSESKIDAVSVVLADLVGYPEEHGSGVLVESVVPGCPADGRLFPGDLIVEVAGEPIEDLDEFNALVRDRAVGRPFRIRVEAGGQTERVRLSVARCAGSHRPLIGVLPVENFPFDVSIESGEIGGPSAGLMWALGLYDLLTPDDVTGGRTVAGTGTIDLDGAVGPVGGVQHKIRAAERAGADLFLVPEGNLAEARDVGAEIRLVAVSSFAEALGALGTAA